MALWWAGIVTGKASIKAALVRFPERRLVALALGLGLSGPVAVVEAAEPGSATSTPRAAGLEEVVVVAQKRETNLQKSAVAITSLASQTLDKANVVDAVDLNGLVPSLIVTTSEGFNRSVAIRGVGFNVPQNDAAQPSVSLHEDGVYIAYPVALDTGFLDVDHIEVQRGPQGTVFGQNSIGGTLNIVNNKPSTNSAGGYADFSFGTFNLEHLRAALNVPLGDQFALRVAVDQETHSGFAKATQVAGTSGAYDLSDDDSVHGRATLLWKPDSKLSVVLTAEYAQANNHETEGKNLNDPSPNPWRETSDWPGTFFYRNQSISAVVSYDAPWFRLKSLTSYQTVFQNGSVNEDGLDLALTSPAHDVEFLFHKAYSKVQEIDVSSYPGGRLEWILGVFYLRTVTKVGYSQYNLSTSDTFDASFLFTPFQNYIPADLYFQSASRLTRTSYSAYGQATFHITSNLRVTGGLRETHDANTTDIHDYFDLYGTPVYVTSRADALTGKAGVEWDVTARNLVYFTYSTGFKPGGGNISLAPAVVPYEYRPETIRSYEVGSKNTMFESRLRLNAAAFYYRYRNMQYEAEDLIPFEGGVDNIPAVSIYGAEGEASVVLPFDLRLDANMTIEKGRVTSHFQALDNVAANAADNLGAAEGYGLFSTQTIALRQGAYRDVYGNAPPMLPEVTASVDIERMTTFPDGTRLDSRLAVQYRDQYNDAIFGYSKIYTAPSYVLWNLYFDYMPRKAPWKFSLNITNLFNADAVLSRFTNQFGGETTQQYAPPRQVIARMGYRF